MSTLHSSDPSSPRDWTIDHTELTFELSADEVVVRGTLTARRAALGADHPTHDGPTADAVADDSDRNPNRLVLDGVGLDVRSIRVDGQPAEDACVLDEHHLTIDLTGRDRATIDTVVAVRPGSLPDMGITAQNGVICTRLEPEGYRRVTFGLDRPDQRSTYDVTLVADPDDYPVLLANGCRSGGGQRADGRQWARFQDPIPKPTYLVAVVAGHFEERTRRYRTSEGREVLLRIVAPPSLVDGADYALELLPRIMAFDEREGGIPYDLDELVLAAVAGYPDATEYHGLMVFEPDTLLTDPAGWVDDDLRPILSNVSHEYFHHTRGNRVTVAGWHELTLKEGLTVLAQNDFREDLDGPVGRILDIVDLRRLQHPEEASLPVPALRDPGTPAGAVYTRTAYLKGAEIFRLLRLVAGRSAWRVAFDSFCAEHDLRAARVDDLVDHLRRAAPEHCTEIDEVARWFRRTGRLSVGTTGGSGEDAGAIAVARWAATEDLALRSIDADRAGAQDEAGLHLTELSATLRDVLRTWTDDPAVAAQLLSLPDEHMIGDRDPVIDVDGVHLALGRLRHRLATELAPSLWSMLASLRDDPGSWKPIDRAVRSLFEISLGYLLEAGDDRAWDLAAETVRTASPNRAVPALRQAAHHEHHLVDELFDVARQRWDGTRRLTDAWIRARTGSRRRDTIDQVDRIVGSDLYVRSDHSRAMAVWFPFCTRNRAVFHDPSGRGYASFVAEAGRLLASNPIVVQRVSSDLVQFRRFDPHRRALMRGHLEAMRSAEHLDASARSVLDRLLEAP